MSHDAFVSRNKAAEIAGVSVAVIDGWLTDGGLQAYRRAAGSRVLLKTADVLAAAAIVPVRDTQRVTPS